MGQGPDQEVSGGTQASAVLAMLWRAQEQMGGWLPEPALRYVADMLGHGLYPRLRDRDVLHHVQSGAGRPLLRAGLRHDAVLAQGRQRDQGHLPQADRRAGPRDARRRCSPGPRSNASAPASTHPWPRSTRTITRTSRRRAWQRILADLKAGRPVTPGPQNGRQASAPARRPDHAHRSRALQE